MFVAVDDHSRIAFTQMFPNEKKDSAEAFLRSAVAYFSSLRVPIRRLITDNGRIFSRSSLHPRASSLGSVRSSRERSVHNQWQS